MSDALDGDLGRLRDLATAAGLPPLVELSPVEARDRVTQGNALCAAGPRLATVADCMFTGPGDSSLRARVYRPSGEQANRTLVYLHGGGWVTGDLEYSDEFCRFLARDAGCTVVSIDYRLAPEHPFPLPLEDAYAGLCWAAQRIARDGLLAIAGDSAGGSLAALCAARAAADGGPRLSFQLLVYPVVDHDLERPSYASSWFPMGAAEMTWFWRHYFPESAERDAASPLRSPHLSVMPRTHVVIAGHDPLHDEAVAFVDRLAVLGVPVTASHHPTLCHGFLRMTGPVPAARAALNELTARANALFAYDEAPTEARSWVPRVERG